MAERGVLVVISTFDNLSVVKSSVNPPLAVPVTYVSGAPASNVTLSSVKFAIVSADASAAKPSAAIATAIPSLVFIISVPPPGITSSLHHPAAFGKLCACH